MTRQPMIVIDDKSPPFFAWLTTAIKDCVFIGKCPDFYLFNRFSKWREVLGCEIIGSNMTSDDKIATKLVQQPPGTVNVMYSAPEIKTRVISLASEIAEALGQDVMVVAILKGSFVFTSDLLRELHNHGVRPRIDFMTLSSYGSKVTSSGKVEITRDITDNVQGANILLIDDILESGRTLAFARELLLERGADQVQLCVLLDKPQKREVEVQADYVGFSIGDHFVVGYGLDYAHYYRELPYIGKIFLD